MRTKPTLPQHNAEIRRLRTRVRDAETKATQARADADAAIAKARAEMEAAWAQVERLNASITAERAALTAFIESPAWTRDLLCLAREQVRAELTALALTHKTCSACGSFGRGFYKGFLTAAIERLGTDHDLPEMDGVDGGGAEPVNWPVRMGAVCKQGRMLATEWLEPRKPVRRRTRPHPGLSDYHDPYDSLS